MIFVTSAHARPDVRNFLTSGNGCVQSPSFPYHVTKKRRALGTKMFRSQTSPVCAHAHTLFSSVKPESLRFLVSGLSEVRNLVPSVFSFSNMAVKQTDLDAVRRASWGKNKKRLICIRPEFVHISRYPPGYALKIPGEIV